LKTDCEITGCPNDATVRVRHCHPDAALRWEANLCREHQHEAFARVGTGEMVNLGPPQENTKP